MSHKRNIKPRKYVPINPNKYVRDINNITMRSGWERKFAYFADTNPNVIKWGSETTAIPYFSRVDRKNRRYFVDFFLLYIDRQGIQRRVMIEIKPSAEVAQPVMKRNRVTYEEELKTWIRNQDKWEAATKYAEKNNFEFKILTEKELGIK